MKAWRPDGPRRVADGYLVPAGADLPALRSTSGASIELAPGAQAASVQGTGAVLLSRGSRAASVAAGHLVVLAAGSRVAGPVTCDGRVVVQDGATVEGPIKAGGDVLLLGRCRVAAVTAGGDILVAGTPATGTLSPKGRVTARDW